MCGISGFWQQDASLSAEQLTRTVGAMNDTLLHRGPDSGDLWTDRESGIAIGHRRLAIIDLSPAGRQPMLSSNQRFVLSYNGEVYNFVQLRKQLEGEGIAFRGGSDTEVLLEACARWGVEAAVKRCTGMFAFALWDRRERRLWLARDRLGIKPLYWSARNGLVLFASELKALRAHPDCPVQLNRDALASFMRHGYVPAPLSIYQDICKLRPGHIAAIGPNGTVEQSCYWRALDIAQSGIQNRSELNEQESLEALEDLLKDAVRCRMVADVPLGAFLSGGIDSSLVVALMQAQSMRPVRTFSIGFREADFNEAHHAKAIAAHLGTDHTELYVESAQAREVIPSLPEFFDEPFADSSQIPTYLVSALTRQHVVVSLSGDGGDELFAGYNRYIYALSLARKVGRIPHTLRAALAGALVLVPPAQWDMAFRLLPGRWRPPQAGDKMHKLARVLRQAHGSVYLGLLSHWQDPSRVVPSSQESKGVLWDDTLHRRFPDLIEYMQYLDTVTYLPDDILTKVDRASMAVSLESRVPLIDHRLVELSWRLAPQLKLRNGVSKWSLRQVLYRYVPASLIDRPKMGFGVPIGVWLRGPLREWAEDLLHPQALEAGGYLQCAPIREKWEAHLRGHQNWQYLLWDVLMFQAWRRRWS